ncbi:MAG: type II CAAX endopeptidase family protein [Anaerolineae bacterium]
MIRSFMARIARPEAAPPWNSSAALQAVVVAFMCMLVGVNGMAAVFGQQPFIFLAGYAVGCALTLVYLWFTRRKAEDRAALRLQTPGSTSLLLIAFLCLGVALASDVLRRYQAVPELQYFDNSALEWVLAIVLMVFLQPLAEEIVFRGVMYPALRVTFGAWTGLFACTLAHAVFHFVSYSPAQLDLNTLWLTFVLPYIDSLVLTLIRAYTGSTRAAIVGHMAFGLFAVVKLIALGSG